MKRKLLTSAVLALLATTAWTTMAAAQDYYDDRPAQWEYGVNLDGR